MGRTLMSYMTLRSIIRHLEQALKSSKYNMETLVDEEDNYRNMNRNFDNYHKSIEGTVLGAGREVLVKYLGREESVFKQVGDMQYFLTHRIYRNMNNLSQLPADPRIPDPRILSDGETTIMHNTEETTGISIKRFHGFLQKLSILQASQRLYYLVNLNRFR